MWQLVKEHPRSFVYALLAHLLLIIMLVINLDWATKPTPAGAPSAPVQAVVIDESKVNAEVERLKTEDQRKVQQEQAAAERLRELEAKTQQAEAARVKEQKKLETLKQKQVVEEKRLKEQESQRKLEQQKLATEQKKLEQKKLEQKQAEQKQQAAEAEKNKQAEEKRLAEAEAKRKIEAEAKARADAEAKAKADAEAKAKAAAEAQRKAAEQALQAQIAAEDAARDQSIISQYVGIIGDRVRRNWIQPPSSRVGLSCVVKVQLMPGGDVISAQVVQGSGDAAFDRSVEAAVYRAAPLPLPPDPGLFESFRTLTFNFSPK